MRYLYDLNRAVVRWKYKTLEFVRSSGWCYDPGVRGVLNYIYYNIYLKPEFQDIIYYIYRIFYWHPWVQIGVRFFWAPLGFFLLRLPLGYLSIFAMCYILASILGGWFVFLFLCFWIFSLTLVWTNLNAWTTKHLFYGQRRFAYFHNLRKKNRHRFLLNAALRTKILLNRKKEHCYLKEVFVKRRWTLGKTEFQDYVFNVNDVQRNYVFFNIDFIINHHISYYKIERSVDPLSRTLFEQEMLLDYMLTEKNMLTLIEKDFRLQQIIEGKGILTTKKIYAKHYVYDHRSNTKVLLSCYALCWTDVNGKCKAILALGPWCRDQASKKPWYITLENQVYKEAFKAGYRIGFAFDRLKITKERKDSLGGYDYITRPRQPLFTLNNVKEFYKKTVEILEKRGQALVSHVKQRVMIRYKCYLKFLDKLYAKLLMWNSRYRRQFRRWMRRVYLATKFFVGLSIKKKLYWIWRRIVILYKYNWRKEIRDAKRQFISKIRRYIKYRIENSRSKYVWMVHKYLYKLIDGYYRWWSYTLPVKIYEQRFRPWAVKGGTRLVPLFCKEVVRLTPIIIKYIYETARYVIIKIIGFKRKKENFGNINKWASQKFTYSKINRANTFFIRFHERALRIVRYVYYHNIYLRNDSLYDFLYNCWIFPEDFWFYTNLHPMYYDNEAAWIIRYVHYKPYDQPFRAMWQHNMKNLVVKFKLLAEVEKFIVPTESLNADMLQILALISIEEDYITIFSSDDDLFIGQMDQTAIGIVWPFIVLTEESLVNRNSFIDTIRYGLQLETMMWRGSQVHSIVIDLEHMILVFESSLKDFYGVIYKILKAKCVISKIIIQKKKSKKYKKYNKSKEQVLTLIGHYTENYTVSLIKRNILNLDIKYY